MLNSESPVWLPDCNYENAKWSFQGKQKEEEEKKRKKERTQSVARKVDEILGT